MSADGSSACRGSAARLSFWVATCAIVVSLGTLGFFKYFLFFEANLNHVLAWFGAGTVRVLAITLPIGISFYTFHALSYTIDVYRGTAPPVRSFIDFACYIALFPQLVAGPIIRYNTVADQLVSRSPHLGEVWLRGHPVHPRLRQEDLAGQSDGPGCGCRVRCPVAFHAGCLVRRAGLRVSDLLRFLRLFRHGHRPGTDDRLRVPEELRFSLQGREHHGLLAALAHLAEYVLARLSLHSPWAAIARAPCAPTSTSSSSCFWAGCGMARTGRSSPGGPITGSCSPSSDSGASAARINDGRGRSAWRPRSSWC